MYETVRCKVKHCNTFSDFMEISVGLKQGDICSPILYSMCVEDLGIYLHDSYNKGLTIDDISIILLMYADATTILSETTEGLQETLDKLYEYCIKWDLKLNTTKMVFRKRGRLCQHEQWSYNDESLEIVDNFNYLGTVLVRMGSFRRISKCWSVKL